MFIFLGVVQYDPLRASTYLPLPKVIKDKKACINIKNDDQKCFLWSVLASLHLQSENADRVTKYHSYENELNMDDIEYPLKVVDISKFENLNNISINIFGLDDDQKVFPVRISTLNNARHHADLLYYAKEETSHYVLIKSLSRLVSVQISRYNGRKFICKYCLHGCSSQHILNKHMDRCQLHGAQRVKLPEPDQNKLFFQKTECQLRLPFVIYADFESILKPHSSAEQISTKPWTQIYQTHEACGFGMYTVSTDKRFYSKPTVEFGENSAESFLDAVLCEANRIRRYLSYKVPMERLTKQQWDEYQSAITCHICGKDLTNEQKKVRDHDHLTGLYSF